MIMLVSSGTPVCALKQTLSEEAALRIVVDIRLTCLWLRCNSKVMVMTGVHAYILHIAAQG